MVKQLKLLRVVLVGHLFINLPIILITIGLPTAIFISFEDLLFQLIGSVLAFVLGLITSVLLWSYLITKWRLWAFNQVAEEDWYTLKEMAVRHKLIWDDGSDFERLEIRKPEEVLDVFHISEKINEQEQIEKLRLNLDMPEKLSYRLSKKDIIIEFFSILLVLSISILGFWFDYYHFIISLILICCIVPSLKNLKGLIYIFDKKYFLIISTEGIELHYPKSEFIRWEDIHSLSVNQMTGVMEIIRISGEQTSKLKCELRKFTITDYRQFIRQIDIIIHRFVYRD